jgi:hypothetical protein
MRLRNLRDSFWRARLSADAWLAKLLLLLDEVVAADDPLRELLKN